MKKSNRSKQILCLATLTLLGGFQSIASAEHLNVAPVVPMSNEQIIRDQLIIIVDETGSIGTTRQYKYEKSLVQAFTGAMPDGSYESGLDSFAGVASKLWLKEPLAQFNRNVMVDAANDLEPLGSLTPLARAIHSQEAEMANIGGRGALLIFSDGKVRNPEEVLQACRDLDAAHGGELCIFTVQIGNSERGGELLQKMATVNGCGKYYHGDSLHSNEAIAGVVRDIFFGPMAVVAPAPTPAPAPPVMSWKINNVLFDNDSSVIKPMYDTLLNEAVVILKENPTVHMHLQGHTDFNASNAYNQKLSERRVAAVKAALVNRSADANRLMTEAYGEERPEVPNDSPEHLHMNRRVELNVVE